MFTTTASGGGSGRRTLTPGTLTLSVAFHGFLVAGAVYASVGVPEEPEKAVDLVTFLDVTETPEPPPPVEAAPAPPVGAPALVPPIDPPPFIPPVDATQPRIDVSLYMGDIPTIDGLVTLPSEAAGAAAATAGEPHENYTYRVEALDSPPVVTNRDALGEIIQREFPRTLANAGINGEAIAEFVVLPDGTIDPGTVRIVSATNEGFAAPTLSILRRLRFKPGMLNGQPVRVLTRIPIVWRVGG